MSLIRPLLCASLCAVAPAAVAQSVASAATINYRIIGIVTNSGGEPIDNAEVSLIAGGVIKLVSASGTDGRFTLAEYPAGKAMLQIRRLGYEQRNINIDVGADSRPTSVAVVLKELPQKLEEVMVKSDERGRLRQFAEHRGVPNNFGRYFDRADIRKRNPAYASEMFRTIPGVQVQASNFGGNTVRVRGCRPLLWVDGQRVPATELDDVARPSDIAGLEFYPSNAGIPAEYMDRDNGACGIIVVWSKSQ
ncbi:MAG: carboxypeptidase regulatory-like domain-containing protein [Gemmatimonadaceae bacterium]